MQFNIVAIMVRDDIGQIKQLGVSIPAKMDTQLLAYRAMRTIGTNNPVGSNFGFNIVGSYGSLDRFTFLNKLR